MTNAVARRRLDQKLEPLRPLVATTRPPRGWVRAIREALGMSLQDMADRLGVAKTAVARIEAHEADGNVRLNVLRDAADVLDCDLVYFLVPRHGLDETVERQARLLARHQLGPISHSMRLEDEEVSDSAMAEHIDDLADQLTKRRRGLWSQGPTVAPHT